MATENGQYNASSTIHNRNYSKQNNDSLKLFNLRPRLHILMQRVVILNTYRTVRKFVAEQ
jgi:hypothetical protein